VALAAAQSKCRDTARTASFAKESSCDSVSARFSRMLRRPRKLHAVDGHFSKRTDLARRSGDGEGGLERPNADDEVVALEFLHRGADLLHEHAL
jgi:hypothetical protein